jgi:DnaJ-class molecular chaperone
MFHFPAKHAEYVLAKTLYDKSQAREERVRRMAGALRELGLYLWLALFIKMLRRFSSKNFYEALGISRTADSAAVKAAYYKLAKKHHPDQDPHSTELFKAASEAYEVLKDEQRRYDYDLQQGFLNALDIDRMEDLEKRFGSKYGNFKPAAQDLWDQLKQFDANLTKRLDDEPAFIKKSLGDWARTSANLKLSEAE